MQSESRVRQASVRSSWIFKSSSIEGLDPDVSGEALSDKVIDQLFCGMDHDSQSLWPRRSPSSILRFMVRSWQTPNLQSMPSIEEFPSQPATLVQPATPKPTISH
jgi:hypothetical protein